MCPLRLLFCLLLCTGYGTWLHAQAYYDWMDLPPHDKGLLLSPTGREMYRSADTSLLSLHPIAVADSATVVGEADGLGYGVSTLVDGTLITAYYARNCHWGCPEKYGPGTSRAVVQYSDDFGTTWSPPRRLDKDPGGQEGPEAALGWGLAFAELDDTTYLATTRGLFTSADRGRSWDFVEGALENEGRSKLHVGPRMFYTPASGFLLFGQPENIELGKMFVHYTLDRGRSWERVVLDTGNPEVTPVEPTAVQLNDSTLIFFTRNGVNGQGSNPAQFILRVHGPGDYTIDNPQITNCTVTGHQDTHDVIYNPVTDSFDATVSDRCETSHDYSIMSLSLWTIPRTALLAGSAEWTPVGYYFPPMEVGRDGEGTHPGGSVVDTVTGKQYLQLHRGVSHAVSSSLYQLSRTLDSDRLRGLLLPLR